MEGATREGWSGHPSGLANCIERDGGLEPQQIAAMLELKAKGRKLFNPRFGGTYKGFKRRPMCPTITDYCVQDIIHLPALWKAYNEIVRGARCEYARSYPEAAPEITAPGGQTSEGTQAKGLQPGFGDETRGNLEMFALWEGHGEGE